MISIKDNSLSDGREGEVGWWWVTSLCRDGKIGGGQPFRVPNGLNVGNVLDPWPTWPGRVYIRMSTVQ